MQLAFLESFLNTLKRFRVIIASVLIVSLLLAGGFFAYKFTTFKHSPDYAYGQFQGALSSLNIENLAKVVNFRHISEHLAVATAQKFPFFHAGPDQIAKISADIQTKMLQVLKTKPDNDENTLVMDQKKLLETPLYLIPKDVIPQLVKNMTLKQDGLNRAYISTSFMHPIFKEAIPITLSLRQNDGTWEVYDIVDAEGLIQHLYNLLDKRLNAQRNSTIKANTDLINLMTKNMEIHSCTASAGLISDRRTLLLVVHIIARNKTNLTVKNVNARVQVFGNKHDLLLERRLNSSQQTGPSADFSHRWTIELDGTTEVGQELLYQGPLTCEASWRAMTMSNSRVIHTEDPPNPVGLCQKHNQQHPDGMCAMEIFLPEKKQEKGKK